MRAYSKRTIVSERCAFGDLHHIGYYETIELTDTGRHVEGHCTCGTGHPGREIWTDPDGVEYTREPSGDQWGPDLFKPVDGSWEVFTTVEGIRGHARHMDGTPLKGSTPVGRTYDQLVADGDATPLPARREPKTGPAPTTERF